MSKKQRQHEKYSGTCWAIAFGQYNCGGGVLRHQMLLRGLRAVVQVRKRPGCAPQSCAKTRPF